MKSIITFLFLISAMCGVVYAQSSLPELEIAKEIKLLKSKKSDVKTIMSEFDSAQEDDADDEISSQFFRSDKALVGVYYSTEDCSGDEDYSPDFPEWKVPKMTATKIVITFGEDPKLEDLGLNLSDFKKKTEGEEAEESEELTYFDENAGIIIQTYAGEVGKIILHPPEKQIGQLCKNENNSEILSGEISFVDSIVRSETYCILRNSPVNVTQLNLRAKGVFDCKNENCTGAKKTIAIETTAVDAENDQLVYNYTVSGGKIDGSGASVVWDLSDVSPGAYTITAGADDGCGICGETQSRKILLKENSYEAVPLVKINELILDKTELVAACPVGRLGRMSCPVGNCGVSVTSVAEGKNLTYRYKNYGGEIIGSGDRVIWDLTGLKPGEYSIMVSASDDETGFGEWETRTVVIKENPYCTVPKND